MLDIAVCCAKSNPVEGLPRLAAVLITSDGSRFVGYNQRKSHPLQKKFGNSEHRIYLHAEIDAIVRACRAKKDLAGASLYVARVLKNGKPALAKPCRWCQAAITHFDIKHVEWTE